MGESSKFQYEMRAHDERTATRLRGMSHWRAGAGEARGEGRGEGGGAVSANDPALV